MPAFTAGAASLPATYMLVGLLRELQPNIPIPLALELRMHPRVMAYAMGLAMLTAVLFALVPALQATRFDVASALHGSTTTFDRRRTWLRHGLVAGQVAIALLLFIATGLFLRSLQQAGSIDAGFNVRDVDTLQIDMRLGGYRGGRAIGALNELIDRFNRIESVAAVGASRMVPLQGGGLGAGKASCTGLSGTEWQRRGRCGLGRRLERLLSCARTSDRARTRLYRRRPRNRAACCDRERDARRSCLAGPRPDRRAHALGAWAEPRGARAPDRRRGQGLEVSLAWRTAAQLRLRSFPDRGSSCRT